jgi:hypothetical protein
MKPKTKSTASAILAALLTLSALTGCAHVSPGGAASRSLYQPPVLRLSPALPPIQTPDGLYRPQVDEVWHSDARYRALERSYLDALAARIK